MALKHSRQRDAIYGFLQGRKDHPTADTVYAAVREQCPNISLGTVYRNLMVLRDEGMIRTVDVGDGVIHFDPDVSEHSHFVCNRCGAVQDIKMLSLGEITREASEHFKGVIDGCNACFFGLCENCLQEANS